jgi:hypothetical protein
MPYFLWQAVNERSHEYPHLAAFSSLWLPQAIPRIDEYVKTVFVEAVNAPPTLKNRRLSICNQYPECFLVKVLKSVYYSIRNFIHWSRRLPIDIHMKRHNSSRRNNFPELTCRRRQPLGKPMECCRIFKRAITVYRHFRDCACRSCYITYCLWRLHHICPHPSLTQVVHTCPEIMLFTSSLYYHPSL